MDSKLLLQTERFRVVETAVEGAAGQGAGARRRQYVEHPGAAVILPLLAGGPGAAGDRVVLIKNRRVAAGRTLVELPAGTLEPPEPPTDTARRELTEETGYTAGRLTELPGFFMSPGILSERMHCFLAEGLTAGPPRREPGEEIENLVVPAGEAIEMVRRGEIEDAKTIALLLYWHTFGR
ncbi:MAG: NUDIX hydrolase [Planctomycetota bacterium]